MKQGLSIVCLLAACGLAWAPQGMAGAAADPAQSEQEAGPASEPTRAPGAESARSDRPRSVTWAVSDGRPLALEYWLPRDQLKPRAAARQPAYCAGAYRFPPLRVPRATDIAELPIEAQAIEADYLRSGEITLKSEVIISRGNQTLFAPDVRFNHLTNIGEARNGLLIEEPQFILRGERGEMNFDTSATRIEGAEFLLVEPQMQGDADTITRDEAKTLMIGKGSFTRCEPGNNNWRITASSLTIEEGAIFGRARNAVLRIKEVPVLYTPYLSFPVSDERRSGWLTPTVGYSDVDGLDVTMPYYLNLAPNTDATVMARYVAERGTGVEAEFRHLSSWEETKISGAFLPDDDLYNGIYDKDDFEDLFREGLVTGEFNPADRWLYAMDHEGRIGPLRTVVDYTAVSDRDYFRNLGTTLSVSSQRELERRGEAILDLGGLSLRLWAQRLQRLDEGPDDYERVPEFAATYSGELPGPFELSVGASASRFNRDNSDLFGVNRLVGNRVHVDPRLRLPLYRPWGFLTLAGGFRYTQYDLSGTQGNFDDNPDRSIGLGSVDAGLFFEREFDWFDSPVVQTLEPRLYYLYQEYEDQVELPRFDAARLTFSFDQLFRENRFAGLDRIGDANQVSAGLTTRLLAPATGREYLRGSIGTIVYFEDREVSLSGVQTSEDRHDTSEVAAELSATFGLWRATASVIWDPQDHNVEEGGAALLYRSDNNRILNLGYRFRNQDDVDQTDVSFIWPLSARYSVIGRWNYDYQATETIEALGGIEYNDCCWQIRLIGRRFIDSPSAREIETTEAEIGAFLQVEFKGLAGIGGKVESLLEKSIRGYRPPD